MRPPKSDEEKRKARLEYQHAYYERNREQRKAYQREYAKKHPQELTDEERKKANEYRRLLYAVKKYKKFKQQ